MAISKKLPSLESKINDLINKGGGTPNEQKKEDNVLQSIQLRLPKNLIAQIDAYCKDDRYQVRKSRHRWILEAIIEKVDRTNDMQV